ncbi:aspartate kinase [Parvicella tangerina]|uniref:Aspartokinase n=1 Tax=Parvicella tangerina TaxID=2829795 RepID=A0A916NA39_9FLAO|nr:aspartate kinase [Parvicella tangerina]CAG5078445.1 Lysine-sensitive aspartokinase 3 [Parvicella tangerina]
MLVMKFGGTSVGSAERMKEVAKLITMDSHKKIVVLSAVSGTTNKLVAIGDALYKQKKEDATSKIMTLRSEYEALIAELYSTEASLTRANELIEENFNYLISFTKDLFTVYEERALLAQGELLSTNLFKIYCDEIGIKTELIPALDFMRIDKNLEPDEYYIQSNLEKELVAHEDTSIFITQGYVCRNAFGEIDNLKRGGSDYTATLIGAAINADEVQIWTDIDGMHNNDPRIVEGTHPVEALSYNEAAELAYFGAKILHPSCVWPAQEHRIPIALKNTMQPEARGTIISEHTDKDRVTAIAAKDGITAIKIKSGRMLNAYGFLRNVFEVFERYKTPIDMITTSEVAVSLTIDDDTRLSDILDELKKYAHVEIDNKQTIVCVVGDFLSEKKGYAEQIFGSLKDIPIRMISYGGSNNNVSILVNESDKEGALKALHSGLFTTKTVA